MNNVLYRGIIVHARDALDGETATAIIVTQENNGYAIWRDSAEDGVNCVRHDLYSAQSLILEEAVGLVQQARAALAKAKG